jgi:hypothetical protein
MDFMVFLSKRKAQIWTSSDKDIGYVATERVVHCLTAQKRKERSYSILATAKAPCLKRTQHRARLTKWYKAK